MGARDDPEDVGCPLPEGTWVQWQGFQLQPNGNGCYRKFYRRKLEFCFRSTPVTEIASETRAWLKTFLPQGPQLCCVGNMCVRRSEHRWAWVSRGGALHSHREANWMDTATEKVKKKKKKPSAVPWEQCVDSQGSAMGVLGFYIPLIRVSWRSHRVFRAGRDKSDYYLIQAYHFTDEISLPFPISHMALRLVSPKLSHEDWFFI